MKYFKSRLLVAAIGALIMNTNALAQSTEDTAIFAGGCFWCMQGPFDKTKGVTKTRVGYTGGKKENPSYEEVSSGTTGHTEAIEVRFDSSIVSYKELLNVFWKNIDPTDASGQFCDKGSQYRAGIFYLGKEQQRAAETSRMELEKRKSFKEEIKTEISEAGAFYPAEEYHQDYYKKNPLRYKFYRAGCGRDRRLSELWGG